MPSVLPCCLKAYHGFGAKVSAAKMVSMKGKPLYEAVTQVLTDPLYTVIPHLTCVAVGLYPPLSW